MDKCEHYIVNAIEEHRGPISFCMHCKKSALDISLENIRVKKKRGRPKKDKYGYLYDGLT